MTTPLRKKINPCTEFHENVSDFREGILDESVQVRLELHRLECARCRKVLVEEEKIASMMAKVPRVTASPFFKDKVLSEWRTRRDSVRLSLPTVILTRLQFAMAAVLGILLALPAVRESLLVSAAYLSRAMERLPAESRERIPITFEIPTWVELTATFQVWQGSFLATLGDLGTAMAPLSGWVWVGMFAAVIVAVANYHWMKNKLAEPLRLQGRF